MIKLQTKKKTRDGKKAILAKKSDDKIGKLIKNHENKEVIVLFQCSCYPEIICMLGSDGLHYKDHFNCKICAETNSCMSNTDDSMELDIRDIKVRAEAALPVYKYWEYA